MTPGNLHVAPERPGTKHSGGRSGKAATGRCGHDTQLEYRAEAFGHAQSGGVGRLNVRFPPLRQHTDARFDGPQRVELGPSLCGAHAHRLISPDAICLGSRERELLLNYRELAHEGSWIHGKPRARYSKGPSAFSPDFSSKTFGRIVPRNRVFVRPWRRGSARTGQALADRQQSPVMPGEEDRALEAPVDGRSSSTHARDDTSLSDAAGGAISTENKEKWVRLLRQIR